MKKRAIVTGGSGFIGSHLVHTLIEKYCFEVLNIDKLTYASNCRYLEKFSQQASYTFLREDICNQEAIIKASEKFKPDVVFHLAAESHVDRSINSAAPFMQTNIMGTYALLESLLFLIKKDKLSKNFRFIHVSTDEVYGSLGFDEVSSTESSIYDPSSPYSASKASSDLIVGAWIKTYDFPAIITHCTNNYGEHQHDEKFIPTVIRCALQNKIIPIYGKGENIRDWLYVKDHCEALLSVFEKGNIGETYNISSSEEQSNNQMATRICKQLDNLCPRPDNLSYLNQIEYVKDRLGHDLRYSLNNQKISQELSWKPMTSLNNALERTIVWYLEKYSALQSKLILTN